MSVIGKEISCSAMTGSTYETSNIKESRKSRFALPNTPMEFYEFLQIPHKYAPER